MTKSLGSVLPDDLLRKLRGRPEDNGDKVIIFSSVGDDGFPHYGMISYYETLAKNKNTILLMLYSDSKSSRNIRKRGLVTLLFVDEDMSYYVKARSIEHKDGISGAPNQAVFELTVAEVLEDKSPSAPITSGIRYAGLDPGSSLEQRDAMYAKLLDLASE